jgi:peptidoglycan/LPS O-acetylase OafA/YrhL
VSNLKETGNRPHFEFLDALRGIAIVGVVLVHSALVSKQKGILMALSFTGQRGVQLFYVISAFTLFLSLESAKSESRVNFFIRRFFRIAPLLYVAILANLLLFGSQGMSKLEMFSGFVFLNGLSPKAMNLIAVGGWSVAVEASFYLFVPFLFDRLKTIKSCIILFLVSASVLGPISLWLASRATDRTTAQYFSFFWFPVEFPVFVLGVLAYLVWQRYLNGREKSRKISGLLIFAAAIVYAANLPFRDKGLYFSSLLFLPLLWSLYLCPWKLLVNGFTKFMGKISYSVYLVHFLVIRLFAHAMPQYLESRPIGLVIVFVSILVLSVPLSTMTWMLVEEPGRKLGRLWIKHREKTSRLQPLVKG